MKKYICFILAVVMMTIMPTAVCAETQSTTINYTFEGGYMIYIPTEINAGESVEIRCENVNIQSDKQISVSFSNLIGDGYVELSNSNSSDIVKVYFENDNGIKYQPGSTIGYFTNESQGTSYSFRTYVDCGESVMAGDYTGLVEFCVSCD